jgi:hypothetical protein
METGIIHHVNPGGLLLEQASPASSRQWLLDGDRMTIGRDPSSGIHVDAFGVSRHHADLLRNGPSWSITDASSTNGTYVNGQRVDKAVLRALDRIRVGQAELVVRDCGAGQPAAGPPGRERQASSATYDIGSQHGINNNVAGSQFNYNNESSLRYVASRRGRARLLIVWGILLVVGAAGLGLFDVLRFDQSILNSINSSSVDPGNPMSFTPPQIPAQFIPIFGLAAFLELIGITMFIFGLIARSGARKEARRIGAQWQ